MNRLLFALLLAAACKHSTSSSSTSHTETSTVTDTQTSESGATTTTTTVTEQPGETTTTTEEFAPPDEKEAVPEQEPPQSDAGSGSQAHAKVPTTIPRHGPLVKRTVTVTRSGGETTQTRQEATSQATGATETKAAGKSDVQAKAQEASAPSAGCIGASWIWGLAVLVGVVGIVYFAVKMRKAV